MASITAADVRSRIAVIADDSMLGRATPSPQLEEVAAWVADQFRQAGLEPGGDSGTFIQRYGLRRLRVDSSSFVMAMGRGAHGHWLLGREAAVVFGQAARGAAHRADRAAGGAPGRHGPCPSAPCR